MTDQHPITPPWDLKQQWREQAPRYRDGGIGRELWLMDRAAQWGADQRGEVNEAKLQQARDQELEACCRELEYNFMPDSRSLRAALCPKPQTRAEIALEQYDRCVSILQEKGYSPAGCIRDALVRLKQLEDSND